MDFLQTLGRRIQTTRERKGITQEDLENLTGLNAKYISSVERGKKNVTVNTLNKIANGLDIELYELFLFSENIASEKIVKKAIDSLLKEANVKTLNLYLEFLKKAQSL